MQRIGRVDRRMNPAVEARLTADHPDRAPLRGEVAYWNFLPPDELDVLLRLYNDVAHKTLKISRTLGIEGKKLLRPEDDYHALREFNESYEGEKSTDENIRLQLQSILDADFPLAKLVGQLPGRVFSDKAHPQPSTQAVFFCYRLPRPDQSQPELPWTDETGETRWFLYQLASEAILEDPSAIIGVIRSTPDTPRHCEQPQSRLAEIRRKVEAHIKTTWTRRMNAPVGVKPILNAWMEIG